MNWGGIFMSIWRDIWRYGVIANRFYAEDKEKGEEAFKKLIEVYDRPEKDGINRQDGMIRFIQAEAYEYQFNKTKNTSYKDNALKLYKDAEVLFPVDHWKKVAKEAHQRIAIGDSPESFFNIRSISLSEDKNSQKNEDQFNKLLWYGFQKTYDFVYLNDFARYVCLSALSRGSSEWPLSLVDFRTVLELEIKQCFPSVVNKFDENQYSLSKTIQKLVDYNLINSKTKDSFDNIRKAGNIAAHELYPDDRYKKENVFQFIKVLDFFNSYRQEHMSKEIQERQYPLCQITLDDFFNLLDKEKESLTKKRYYD